MQYYSTIISLSQECPPPEFNCVANSLSQFQIPPLGFYNLNMAFHFMMELKLINGEKDAGCGIFISNQGKNNIVQWLHSQSQLNVSMNGYMFFFKLQTSASFIVTWLL